jgi:membrane associated rhomboid family serine protease
MYSRAVTDRPAFDFMGTLANSGPLARPQALAALDHAAELMEQSQFVDAARLYQRIIGTDDQGITSAAMLGYGQAMHRLDDEGRAMGAWQEVVRLPLTPATYPAWRELAGARVRTGDLAGALEAYRQADRLAPPQDKPEIASRLGWISKELGDPKAAGKYFSQARGGSAIAMTLSIIAVTAIVSLVADIGGPDGGAVMTALQLDKAAVAHGQLYRLLTAALVHAPFTQMPLHLIGNLYGLWIAGSLVERLYGRARLLGFYLVFAIAGSLATFAFGQDSQVSVGASGAIFGLFGIVVSALVIQRPSLGPATRTIAINFAVLIGLNLYIGLTTDIIDNFAHLGGLAAGLWFGLLFIPTGVPSPHSLWNRAGAEPGTTEPILGRQGMLAVQVAGLVGLLVAFGVLWSIGYPFWHQVAPVS